MCGGGRGGERESGDGRGGRERENERLSRFVCASFSTSMLKGLEHISLSRARSFSRSLSGSVGYRLCCIPKNKSDRRDCLSCVRQRALAHVPGFAAICAPGATSRASIQITRPVSPLHVPYALGGAAFPARLHGGGMGARQHPALTLMASICRHTRRGPGVPTDCETLVAISSSERLPLRCSRNLHTCSAWHVELLCQRVRTVSEAAAHRSTGAARGVHAPRAPARWAGAASRPQSPAGNPLVVQRGTPCDVLNMS